MGKKVAPASRRPQPGLTELLLEPSSPMPCVSADLPAPRRPSSVWRRESNQAFILTTNYAYSMLTFFPILPRELFMLRVRFAWPALTVSLLLLSALIISITLKCIRKPIPASDPHPEISLSNSPATDPVSASLTSKNLSSDKEERKPSSYSIIRSFLGIPRKATLLESYRLRGIVIYDSASRPSSALLEDLTTGTRSTYFLNGVLPDGSRIVDLRGSFIVLEKEGIRREVHIFPQGTDDTRNTTTPSGSNGYHKLDTNEWNLNPYKYFAGDARSVLNLSLTLDTGGDHTGGLRVNDVSSSPLISQLGVRDGDILSQVNGVGLNSLYNCVKAWLDASTSDELELKVLRGGTIVTLKYHLLWEGIGTWTTEDVLKSRAVLSLLNSKLLIGGISRSFR